jgi:hypothetical protein
MKPRAFVFSISVFMLFPALGCQAEEKAKAEAQAQAGEKEYTWNFGKIKKGATKEVPFIFTNTTKKVLHVTGINTSCGCTGSTIKDKTLQSGQSTEVLVKFNSAGYPAGPVTKVIFIAVDDPDNPVIRYEVKIKVVE